MRLPGIGVSLASPTNEVIDTAPPSSAASVEAARRMSSSPTEIRAAETPGAASGGAGSGETLESGMSPPNSPKTAPAAEALRAGGRLYGLWHSSSGGAVSVEITW